MRHFLLLFLAAGLLLADPAAGQINPTDPKVPHPFWFKSYAQGLPAGIFQPTCITFDQQDRLWVANLTGTIIRLEDKNRDGKADIPYYLFPYPNANLPGLEGILFVGSDMWVSFKGGTGTVGIFKDTNKDGDPDPVFTQVVGQIPVNYHQNNQLVLGSDGWIYFSVGAYNNAQAVYPNLATILRLDPAAANPGATLEVFATGLRNCYDLCFDTKGNLFAGENGRDDLGLQAPPEELDHVVKGGFYGFPNEGSGTIPPVATFAPHSSPCGLVQYNHTRFPGFAGDLLMVLYSSLPVFSAVNTPANTRKVVRVELSPSGSTFTGKVQDWVTHFGLADPPLDLTVSPEGEVFMITHNPNYLPDARVLKISHPYLKVEGQARRGAQLPVRTWGKTGWSVFVLCGLPAPLPLPLPMGEFGLDLRFFFLCSSGFTGADDQHLTNLPIPNDPALAGAKLALQGIVGPLTQPQLLVLTNWEPFTIK